MSILITGSNTGFGKLAAISLARTGKKVIATMRDPNKGDDVRRVAKEEELPIEIRQLDVCAIQTWLQTVCQMPMK